MCLLQFQSTHLRHSFTIHLFACLQAFFAKYDAAALYLSRRKYPPGLTYVEKNTFRRFCKKFLIKGLHRSHRGGAI